MDNFDLKKYLAEGRLFEEDKTIDVYGDGDVVVDISKATPEQERVINFEFEVSEFSNSEEAQEVVDQIMNLNSAKEVKNYYDNVRGWATVDYLDTYKALNAFVGNKPIAEGRLFKEEVDYSSIKDEMKKIYDIDVDLDTIKDFVTSYNDSEGMDVFDTTEREDFYLYLKDLAEGKLYENEYFDAYHEAGDKLENHPNYNKLVSILKDKGFEPDGTPYSDGTGRRDVHGVWDVFKSYTTEPGSRGTTLTKANAKDINDALRQAGIEDIKATPSNSYSFRLKVNNLAEGKQLNEFVGKELEDRNEALYDDLVPGDGKADTVQGEMLRAINRIVYRYYNDGDEYHTGYGTETAGPAHSYLVNANHPLRSLVSTLFKNGTNYEQTIKDVLDAILDHIESRRGKYAPNSEDMYDYEPEFENDEFEEEDYGYDYDDDDYDY